MTPSEAGRILWAGVRAFAISTWIVARGMFGPAFREPWVWLVFVALAAVLAFALGQIGASFD